MIETASAHRRPSSTYLHTQAKRATTKWMKRSHQCKTIRIERTNDDLRTKRTVQCLKTRNHYERARHVNLCSMNNNSNSSGSNIFLIYFNIYVLSLGMTWRIPSLPFMLTSSSSSSCYDGFDLVLSSATISINIFVVNTTEYFVYLFAPCSSPPRNG